jgi:thioredoxin-like negative regulator of GroEL
MSWLVPVLVLIGTGLLVYMMYKYWCGRIGDSDNNNNDLNGVFVISNMTNKDGSKAPGKSSGKSTGQVIDLQGNQLMSKQDESPVIVAIMAEGCGHCTQLKPKYHEAAKLSSKQLYSLYAHSPGGMEVCKALQIRGFPTIICLHKGKIVSEFNLERTPHNIAQWAESL